jgi:hypothetical protein
MPAPEQPDLAGNIISNNPQWAVRNGERESRSLRLTGDCHDDSGFGPFVEQLMAEHQDRTKTSLLAASDRG